MARKSRRPAKSAPAIDAPRSWEDVDALLRLMARTEGRMAAAKAEADERVRAVNADLKASLAPMAMVLDAAQERIEEFAGAHRKDFGDSQSLALAHGRVGWRKSPAAVDFGKRTQAEIVEALEREGLDVAIMMTKRPSKDVLATFDEAVLKRLGIRLVQAEPFYIEFTAACLSEAMSA